VKPGKFQTLQCSAGYWEKWTEQYWHIIILKPTNSKEIYVLKHNLLQERSNSAKEN